MYMAYGITATGKRVPLTVVREVSPTGLVIPSVILDGQVFDRVVVDVAADPADDCAYDIGLCACPGEYTPGCRAGRTGPAAHPRGGGGTARRPRRPRHRPLVGVENQPSRADGGRPVPRRQRAAPRARRGVPRGHRHGGRRRPIRMTYEETRPCGCVYRDGRRIRDCGGPHR